MKDFFVCLFFFSFCFFRATGKVNSRSKIIYLLLTEFAFLTVSYRPSFLARPKREYISDILHGDYNELLNLAGRTVEYGPLN